MSDSRHRDLAALLERVRAGEEAACKELLARVYDDVLRLSANILHRKFPRLAQQHSVESVAHEAIGDLKGDLQRSPPVTVPALFAYIGARVRWVLLDLSKRKQLFVSAPLPDSSAAFDPAGDSSLDGARLAEWTELHRKAAELPDDERLVFEMHYYCGLTQAEVAEELGRHPKEISRLWLSARRKLAELLG